MPIFGFPSKRPKQTAKHKAKPAYVKRAKARAVKNAQDENRGMSKEQREAQQRRLARLRQG